MHKERSPCHNRHSKRYAERCLANTLTDSLTDTLTYAPKDTLTDAGKASNKYPNNPNRGPDRCPDKQINGGKSEPLNSSSTAMIAIKLKANIQTCNTAVVSRLALEQLSYS